MQLFGTKEQKFLHCPGTKGQQDKLKILPRDGTAYKNHGRNAGQSLFFSYDFLSCPVLERYFPVIERDFPVFLFFLGESDFVPGFLLLPLSWDKGKSRPLETLVQGKGGLISRLKRNLVMSSIAIIT